ncbi:hypothetical protein CYMTET_31074 [Cymbomonas tetramitiformis]|uniref:MATH domain-containing protein n=1 Tax=Cymbomonas tetramitiformis TaxID=36881 RepID=A0AAE0KT87_9CHLO|nr:hypothetical protein CYMTET_31074 [Cymbomonas tetramitiformis]
MALAYQGESDDPVKEYSPDSVVIESRGEHAAVCRWSLAQYSKVKARALWSKYFTVGGYDCRLLVYPKGDSQALPGYLSIYLQVTDTRPSAKWDCFASYRLSVVNQRDGSKSLSRDSWHRFSGKKKSHGWCDFSPSTTIADSRGGFIVNDTLLVTAEILVLNESVTFSRDNELTVSLSGQGALPEVLSGKFTWKVCNFSLFKEMIKTQKIMSPVFPAGECNLRLSVYQSSVNGWDYLSMCLESKDAEKTTLADRSCWCLFRMSVLNQTTGRNHMHRDSYGRFAADNKSGDNTSLGWNDYMKMEDFTATDTGYLIDDTAVFSASFHIIKESSNFSKSVVPGGRGQAKKASTGDCFQGKFTWRIENFTKLKDLLKKRKITGLCIKSKRFQVGGRDCRLIVYPRGQSQPPCHLSMFLEVTDPRSSNADWSCFVSHRLSVVNQRTDAVDRSVTKESQNRYSRSAKDWGWREFVTLTSLFDQDSGFLVNDTVVFSAEVLVLRETSEVRELTPADTATSSSRSGSGHISFVWRVENFIAFKEIMESRKIFSKYFLAGNCELRIGVYESFDTLCIYLESDALNGDLERNFWVRYRIAVVNQKNAARTLWKESSICTKTWNNSVLQFMKVSDMLDTEGGFLHRDTVAFTCEILDCCPWFEFADLEIFASDDEQDALSTDPDELIDSEDSEGISGDEEDIFRNLLARAGLHLSCGDSPPTLMDPAQLQVTLREKLLIDAGSVGAFLAGLRLYLDEPEKAKRLLMPTVPSTCISSPEAAEASSPSLLLLLLGVTVLQQAIVDLLLDIMLDCCTDGREGFLRGREGRGEEGLASGASTGGLPASGGEREPRASGWRGGDGGGRAGPSAGAVRFNPDASGLSTIAGVVDRLDNNHDSGSNSCVRSDSRFEAPVPVQSPAPEPRPVVQEPVAEASPSGKHESAKCNKVSNWPCEQSEELMGLIVKALYALDDAGPLHSPESRYKGQIAAKIAVLLQSTPLALQKELINLASKLVHSSEHVGVANSLLACLKEPVPAEKARDVEELRAPVLAALSRLRLDAAQTAQALQKALLAIPDLDDASLPAVVGFVLKAASEKVLRSSAVPAVRSRLRRIQSATHELLDAMREAVSSRMEVAGIMLAAMDAECRMPAGEDEDEDEEDEEACESDGFRVVEVEMLLEMLLISEMRDETVRVVEKGVLRGVVGEEALVAVLNRRREKHLVAAAVSAATRDPSDGMHVEGGRAMLAMETRTIPGGGRGMQTVERCYPGTMSGMQDDGDAGLDPHSAAQSDFEAVLHLAESMLGSTHPRAYAFTTALYSILFVSCREGGASDRMTMGLVDRWGSLHDARVPGRVMSGQASEAEVQVGMDILGEMMLDDTSVSHRLLLHLRDSAQVAEGDAAALRDKLQGVEEQARRAQGAWGKQQVLQSFLYPALPGLRHLALLPVSMEGPIPLTAGFLHVSPPLLPRPSISAPSSLESSTACKRLPLDLLQPSLPLTERFSASFPPMLI